MAIDRSPLWAAVAHPLASTELDNAAKTFTPPNGKANIYVARGMGYFGGAVNFQVGVDRKICGNIAPGTYFVVVCDPGSHTVVGISQYNTAKGKVDVEGNKNYFLTLGGTRV